MKPPLPDRGATVPALVDGHVHFHGAYVLDRFLDAAAGNFERAAHDLVVPAANPRFLMMTEAGGDDWFRRWAEGERGRRWRFEPCGDGRSLLARRDDTPPLTVVAGRQLQTAEGVELLLLGAVARHEDGMPVRELLEIVGESDAVPVVPWGFGKWWLGRGRLLRELLEDERGRELFLADTASRLRGTPDPPLMRAAAARARPVLAGSDPLPFAGEERRAGSFGFELSIAPDAASPAKAVLAAIRALEASPRRFGRLESVGGFVRNQVAMQWRKRGPGARP